MVETSTSPQVPSESITNRLPAIQAKRSAFDKFCFSYSLGYLNEESKPEFTTFSFGERGEKSCNCPHVLLADDDPFQAFYFESLFQKSLDFEGLSVDKKDFRFEAQKSGEELIDRYKKIISCCGQKPLLIVTDYNMGLHKLNGIETCLKIRKCGYKGPLILRTSETQEVLGKLQPDFKEMLKNKTINFFIEKSSHAKTKEILRSILKQDLSPLKLI